MKKKEKTVIIRKCEQHDAPAGHSYKDEIDLPAEKLQLLDGAETFLRIIKFKTKPGAAEALIAQEKIDLEDGDNVKESKVEFILLDGVFNDRFYIEIFKAIRNDPKRLELFENLGRLINMYNSPAREMIEKVVDNAYEDNPEEFAGDLLLLILKSAFKTVNTNTPKNKGQEDEDEDTCQCAGCRARRAFGIPKPGSKRNAN